MTRADVVTEARKHVGDRWSHQALLSGVASDCYGLITVVALALGVKEAPLWITDPALKGYGRSPDSAVLLAACQRYLDPVPIAQAGLGDLLAIRWETEPQHFAIISRLDPTYIIHGYAAVRKVVEHNIVGEWKHGKPWLSLIDSVWRFRGVTD